MGRFCLVVELHRKGSATKGPGGYPVYSISHGRSISSILDSPDLGSFPVPMSASGHQLAPVTPSLSCPVGPTSNTCHVLTPGVCRPVARAASAHLSHLLPRYKSKEAVYLSVQQGHLAAAAWLRDVLGRGEGRTFKLFSLFWKI